MHERATEAYHLYPYHYDNRGHHFLSRSAAWVHKAAISHGSWGAEERGLLGWLCYEEAAKSRSPSDQSLAAYSTPCVVHGLSVSVSAVVSMVLAAADIVSAATGNVSTATGFVSAAAGIVSAAAGLLSTAGGEVHARKK